MWENGAKPNMHNEHVDCCVDLASHDTLCGRRYIIYSGASLL